MALTSSQPVVLNVDSLLLRKTAVAAVAVANVDLNETLNDLDGVNLVENDRVLLTAQTAPAENGLYKVPANGQLSGDRATDADAAGEFGEPWIVRVTGGTVYAGVDFVYMYAGSAVTLGTTALRFRAKNAPPVVLTP